MGENVVRQTLEQILESIEQKRRELIEDQEENRRERETITQQYFEWHTKYNAESKELEKRKDDHEKEEKDLSEKRDWLFDFEEHLYHEVI